MNVFELQDRCEKLRAPGYLELTISMSVSRSRANPGGRLGGALGELKGACWLTGS